METIRPVTVAIRVEKVFEESNHFAIGIVENFAKIRYTRNEQHSNIGLKK